MLFSCPLVILLPASSDPLWSQFSASTSYPSSPSIHESFTLSLRLCRTPARHDVASSLTRSVLHATPTGLELHSGQWFGAILEPASLATIPLWWLLRPALRLSTAPVHACSQLVLQLEFRHAEPKPLWHHQLIRLCIQQLFQPPLLRLRHSQTCASFKVWPPVR